MRIHLPKKCNYPCCKAIAEIESSRCKDHRHESRKQASTTKNRHIYTSRRWLGLRKIKLANNPLCEICLEHNAYVKGVIIDHVKEINDGGAIWDYSNLMTLCLSCHSFKSGVERRKRKKQ